jgi:hypothetical protein
MNISIHAPYVKERFETARQHPILHPERIVGNPKAAGTHDHEISAGGSALVSDCRSLLARLSVRTQRATDDFRIARHSPSKRRSAPLFVGGGFYGPNESRCFAHKFVHRASAHCGLYTMAALNRPGNSVYNLETAFRLVYKHIVQTFEAEDLLRLVQNEKRCEMEI